MSGVTLIGVPWDRSSSFQRGAAEAPPAIRRALTSPSSNAFNERGDDITAPGMLEDGGDLPLGDEGAESRRAIEARIREVLQTGRKPLVLGGDHSITYPVMRAVASRHGTPGGGRAEGLTILHFDAHGDLYDEFDGDRFSHACPFARVMEERLAARLVQVGVRTLTSHQRTQAAKFGVEVLGPDRWRDAIPQMTRLHGPLYVSLDLDVLDPAFAPGVAHPEPGGLSVREVLDVLNAVRSPVVGADVVEYHPQNDVRDLTARVAAKFVKELVGMMRR
jgi:agmatinase